MSPRPPQPRTEGAEDRLRARLAAERAARGMTHEALAQALTAAGCPMNQSATWRIENGEPRRRITLDEAVAMARVFDIPLAELVDGRDPLSRAERARQAVELVRAYLRDEEKGREIHE